MSSESVDLERVPSVIGGERAEAAVIQRVPELRWIPDDQDEHVDAVVTETFSASREVPTVGLCLLEEGTDVEIKSCMARNGEDQRRGRFYIRELQHQELLERGGVYLFAVTEPTPEREPIALKIVPASTVDSLVSSWHDCRDRAARGYTQLTWSRLFAAGEVEDGQQLPGRTEPATPSSSSESPPPAWVIEALPFDVPDQVGEERPAAGVSRRGP
jgi:hypothetical protein